MTRAAPRRTPGSDDVNFGLLALVVAVGFAGPLLAARDSWHVPVVVGELAAGIVIGVSGLRLVDPSSDDFTLLADIGFGLTMVVVGSQIPIRDTSLRGSIGRGILGALAVGVAAAVLGVGIAALFSSGHAALYAVLLASSSAALVLPMLRSVGLSRGSLGQLVAQIAVADIACIVALPLVVAPARAGGAALAVAVIAIAAAILAVVLVRLQRTGARRRLHMYSERRRFALELRLSLLVLFAFAAIAQFAGLSIMIAGFAVGLVLSAGTEPHRLARQLFGMTEGFFGPLFFVWLGASIDLRALGAHPAMIVLGVVLGVAAVAAHLVSRAAGLPLGQGVASAGQLGVPVAAVTLGIRTGALLPGEDGAILLGALVSVGFATLAVATLARRQKAAGAPTARDLRP
ncbi:cation:proton antiporter [Leifsonia sp. AG29]|uniref:cation:proton antiporter n=1 Tax=Leifsonia sp. AG29 TaxID=2598860 RepID=UPI0018EF29E5|nr:cation:proton antiporter [Leifsonia sp. AG29]